MRKTYKSNRFFDWRILILLFIGLSILSIVILRDLEFDYSSSIKIGIFLGIMFGFLFYIILLIIQLFLIKNFGKNIMLDRDEIIINNKKKIFTEQKLDNIERISTYETLRLFDTLKIEFKDSEEYTLFTKEKFKFVKDLIEIMRKKGYKVHSIMLFFPWFGREYTFKRSHSSKK